MIRMMMALAGGLIWSSAASAIEQYTIQGEFEGCEYGKMYELDQGRILECYEYNYFYEYGASVVAQNDQVAFIGDERVQGRILTGQVVTTNIDGDFDGCDFGKLYRLMNGWIFECESYGYSFDFSPELRAFMVAGTLAKVTIGGEEYQGRLLEGYR